MFNVRFSASIASPRTEVWVPDICSMVILSLTVVDKDVLQTMHEVNTAEFGQTISYKYHLIYLTAP